MKTGSNFPPAHPNVPHSAWQPYAVLPPVTRKKFRSGTTKTTPAKSFAEALLLPDNIIADRVTGKLIQLEPPEGKMSDRRKAELAKRDKEKAKKEEARKCGLVGRRKRARGEGNKSVQYEAVLPLYSLWLSYMAELLTIPILLPSPVASTSTSTSAPALIPTASTSTSHQLPTFPVRTSASDPQPPGADLKLNVQNIQTKLLKAELVGSILTVIPKPSSIFLLVLPLKPEPNSKDPGEKREMSFDIYGDAFGYRASDRVGKKWKAGGGDGGVGLL
ncbi:ribonuclease P protein subunit POP4 [Pseudohyphozyma bogoriensis]|nr:ribonuclease P protein subunit POP4 [Pseudohyphozyma bogoriensis]